LEGRAFEIRDVRKQMEQVYLVFTYVIFLFQNELLYGFVLGRYNLEFYMMPSSVEGVLYDAK
jgi:hypothetical protein